MNNIISIYKREVKSYFSTPVAYVFLVIFLFFSSFLTFQNGFFEANQASMRAFFYNMPLLFLFFIPAISMRLWSEEHKSNTIELLFTLPITTFEAVIGKFFAALTVIVIAILLTFPMILTVVYLGNPDPGPIVTGYIGLILMAGAYLAIGSFFSAITKNQVISFILSIVGCSIFLYSSSPSVLNLFGTFLPSGFLSAFQFISFQSRFESMMRGVLEFRDVIFFILMSAGWLIANAMIVEERKGA
jgi:ABC-2 type transport system permease protein